MTKGVAVRVKERGELPGEEDIKVSGTDGQPVIECHLERDRKVMRAVGMAETRGQRVDEKAK